jgi:GST-like protein
MTLTFYRAPFSSATPVAVALAELDVPHEAVSFDLKKTDHKQPEFLKLNPNGKVPTLVVDGTPMFEAVAIMQWLGDRYGVARKLWPAFDTPERLVALSWTTWGYVTYGPAIVRHYVATHDSMPAHSTGSGGVGSGDSAARMHNAAQGARAQQDLDEYRRILEARFTQQPCMLGEQYSLVDLVLANVVQYGVVCAVPIDDYPKTKAWLRQCLARPSFKSEWG